MGFWPNIRASWRKSRELKRISAKLDPGPPRIDVQWLMQTGARANQAQEELFDLVEGDQVLKAIMLQFGADREVLRRIYQTLLARGAGWARGQWVPASAIAFGVTLAYCLEKTRNGTEKDYDVWVELAYRLNEYFARGETGRIL